jgi:hypothetical protein
VNTFTVAYRDLSSYGFNSATGAATSAKMLSCCCSTVLQTISGSCELQEERKRKAREKDRRLRMTLL